MNMDISHSILLIDDDADDKELLEHALKKLDVKHTMIHASNGEEGLVVLERLIQDRHAPCLIVLDINMPKLDGRQTFDRISGKPHLATIPVVILSTSVSESDRNYFSFKKVEYLVKPFQYDQLIEVARRLLLKCTHQATR